MRDVPHRTPRFSPRQLLTTAVALLFAGNSHAADSITLTPCQLPDVAEPARCGTLEVPENPGKPHGRRLQIGVAVIPATGKARPDPLVPLLGGPSEEAISSASYFVTQFAPLRRDHDILLVDQRGTGRSGALRCDLYAADDPAV